MSDAAPAWQEALGTAGIAATNVVPLYRGVNSERFAVSAGAARYFVKCYLGAPEEQRARLRHEVDGLRFLAACGVDSVSAPVAVLEAQAVVCFPWHECSPIVADAVSRADCEALAACYAAFPHADPAHRARIALCARDAAFSPRAHLDLVEARVRRLADVPDESLRTLLRNVLLPCWTWLLSTRRPDAELPAWGPTGELSWSQRIFSPSDAGLHNVAWDPATRRLRCFDFEYCGWDDPAKLLCDCVLQPAVPLPAALVPTFVAAFLAHFPEDPQLLARARWLYPVLAVKWACIVLNPFLPPWAAHHPPLDTAARASRLQRAADMLQHAAMPEPSTS